MTDDLHKSQIRLVRWLLLLGTLWVYYPVTHYPYITYDDYYYLEVKEVQAGLTWSGIRWAFATGLTGNWHPLTWISHMLDCQLFGFGNAGGHHLTNVLFHAANSLLMFELWRRLTGRVWRSALVAALFAWHPLHVESVAWVAERKDVLSAFFFFLTLLAYLRFVRAPRNRGSKSKPFYWLALLWFALGLMAKPMLVTLPFVLWLLDFWPLGRISWSRVPAKPNRQSQTDFGQSGGSSTWRKLLLEKIPFLLLSAASCVITYGVQAHGGNMKATSSLSLGVRTCTAMLGYAAYLQKAFWPVDLAIFYPYPPFLQHNQVLAAAGLLAVISTAAMLMARSKPYFFAGWFWFIGMLVPVIGLVTVGAQAYADRYTYLPLTGIFVALVWGAGDFSSSRPPYKLMGEVGAVMMLAACLMMTRRQVGYWQNSLTLFTHAGRITRDNPVVENNLGLAMENAGKLAEAEKCYETSLKLVPDFTETWDLLGLNLASQSNYPGAIECYQQELRLGANSGMVHYHYANALLALGDLTNAYREYSASIRLNSLFAPAHNNIGAILLREGRLEDARAEFEDALRLQPAYPQAQDQLGHVFLKLGQPAQALPCFRQAVELAPTLADAQLQLGFTLASQGSLNEALEPLQTAVKLEPNNSQAVFTLGALYDALQDYDRAADSFSAAFALDPKSADAPARLGSVEAKRGNYTAAIQAYHQALALNPNTVNALQGLAWILATSSHPELRNGAEALQLARQAVDLTHHQQPLALSALDAALAETGRFAEAIQAAQETAQVARNAHQNEIAALALARLEQYKSRKPYRENTR